MAFPFPLVNQRPTTGNIAMFLVLSNFIAAGWTVQSSSDGTTYNSSGNQITSGNSGANGLGNNYAWFCIQDPGGGRQFIVQRNGSGLSYQWAIKYSVAAKFTGGSPSATQVPTATDEVPIWGNITGATQTYATLWNNSDGTYNLHMVMGDASVQYAFWMCALVLATPNANTCGAWFMDFMVNPDAGDLDPTVHYAASGTASFRDTTTSAVSYAFFTSITSANFLSLKLQPWLVPGSGIGIGIGGQAMGYNSLNGLEDTLPMMWASSSAGQGYKGWSTLFQTHVSGAHEWGDLGSIGNPPVFGVKNFLTTSETGGSAGGIVVAGWPAGVDCIN
jgi:hypothetical protein